MCLLKSVHVPTIISHTIVALSLLVSPLQASPHASRVQRNINDSWMFALAGDTSTVKVHLPHCWNEDAYSSRDYYRGEGVYSRKLNIPASMQGKSIYLKFDGAASASEVYIDGRKVASHAGAYSPHLLDITSAVTPGRQHELTVRVTNGDRDIPPYSADFTFMGGLYRDAWLIVLNPVHLDITGGPAEGFRATPRLQADGTGSLTVDGRVVNQSDRKTAATVNVSLRDGEGRLVAERRRKLSVPAGDAAEFSIDFGQLADIQSWTPSSPTLYSLTTQIIDGKHNIIDSGATFIGFRNFGFDSEGRFILNGSPLKLRGMCRHQDQFPMGIALSDEQHRRDMELIKDMGANFIRISHYPQDEAILEMCDRLGLIAWEEIPVIDYLPDSERFNANAETMLREMIQTHYNHPSVVMWGYMNEILLRTPDHERDATRRRTLSLAEHLEQVLAREDSTRLSAMAFHGSDVYHEAGLADITDVKGWNLYQGWYGGELPQFEEFLSRQHRQHPSHRLIVSEYGAGSDLRLHSFWPRPFDFSIEYQQQYLEHYLPVIEDSAFVAGASHWNFIDFSSANRAESMPHINNKGLVTNSRRKKDVYHYYRAAWHTLDEDTVAHIAVRDWPERTDLASPLGTSALHPVKVYTTLPEVILRVNGTELPARGIVNYNTVFHTPLRDGTNLIELLDASQASPRVLDAATIEMNLIPVRDGALDLGTRELAVNVGSDCYFRSDDSGLTWLPDREYYSGQLFGHIGGSRSVSQDEIELTRDTPLLQHALTGLEAYRFDLLPGSYEVELTFADLASPSALSAYMLGFNAGSGETPPVAMDIEINGLQVESAFAPAAEVGVKTMVRRRYTTEVGPDGALTVKFTPAGGTTSLSAVKLRKL